MLPLLPLSGICGNFAAIGDFGCVHLLPIQVGGWHRICKLGQEAMEMAPPCIFLLWAGGYSHPAWKIAIWGISAPSIRNLVDPALVHASLVSGSGPLDSLHPRRALGRMPPELLLRRRIGARSASEILVTSRLQLNERAGFQFRPREGHASSQMHGKNVDPIKPSSDLTPSFF